MIEEKGYPPTLSEISEHFHFSSPTAALSHLQALKNKGYIERIRHVSRGIRLLSQGAARSVPILGQIVAGRPLLAEENIEGQIHVDYEFCSTADSVFALKVQGDSMVEDGIFEGDYILVRCQPTAIDGEIVVAMVQGETTVKRFYQKGNQIELRPANPDYDPIVANAEDVQILGKVIGLVRKY